MRAHSGIRFSAALFLAAALAWSQGGSNAARAEPNAGPREIYQLSDLSGRIQLVLGYANEALAKRQAQFTAEQFEVAKQVIRQQFAAEKLERRLLQILEERAGGDYPKGALDWLRTPLGRKIMRARIASYDPVDPAEMADFAEQRQANPPSQKRLELIERYSNSALLSSVDSMTVLFASYGVAAMVEALKPEGERLGPEALMKSMDSQRALLEPIFEETSAVTSLFAFRNLSDEEIEALVAFSESEAGQWYHGTTSSTFVETLRETTASLGDAFLAALRARSES
jgi:hypothetical protein